MTALDAQTGMLLAATPNAVMRATLESLIVSQIADADQVIQRFFIELERCKLIPSLRGAAAEAHHQMCIRLAFFQLVEKQPRLTNGSFMRLNATILAVAADAFGYLNELEKHRLAHAEGTT